MGFKQDQIIALAAGTLVEIVLGSLYTFGAITPYIYSYLHYQKHDTSLVSLSILFTIAIIMVNVGQIATIFLDKYIGNRGLCALAVTMVAGSVFICSFMNSLPGFAAFYGVLYGLSIGLGYLAPVKNAYLHLPNRKGLCAGICMSGFGIGSMIFNQILVQLINPHDEKADSNKIFPLEVADRLPFTMRVLAAVYFSLGIIGVAFIRPPKKARHQPLIQAQSINSPASVFTTSSPSSYAAIQSVQLTPVTSSTSPSPVDHWQVFKQKKAYLLIVQYSLIIPFGMFTAFNYKQLAFNENKYFLEHDHLITLIGSVGIMCNGLFRLMWGYLFDHFPFEKLILAINLVLFLCCGSILFAVNNFYTYMLVVTFNYLAYGGTYALIPTQTFRVLGSQAGSKVFWLIFSSYSISAILQFVIHYFLLTYLQHSKGYKISIIIFLAMQTLGLALNLKVKYRYDEKETQLLKKR